MVTFAEAQTYREIFDLLNMWHVHFTPFPYIIKIVIAVRSVFGTEFSVIAALMAPAYALLQEEKGRKTSQLIKGTHCGKGRSWK